MGKNQNSFFDADVDADVNADAGAGAGADAGSDSDVDVDATKNLPQEVVNLELGISKIVRLPNLEMLDAKIVNYPIYFEAKTSLKNMEEILMRVKNSKEVAKDVPNNDRSKVVHFVVCERELKNEYKFDDRNGKFTLVKVKRTKEGQKVLKFEKIKKIEKAPDPQYNGSTSESKSKVNSIFC